VKVSIEITGQERLDRAFKGMADDLSAPIRPVARPLSDVVLLMVRGQYSSNGRRGPRGKAWSRKQSTIDRYTAMNRRGFSVVNQNMRRTDALYISESTRGGPGGIYEVEDDSLTMGTSLRYGKILQDRGQTQYDPTEADIRDMLRVIRNHQGKQAADRGFDYQERETAIPF
jgi:hypothetical protein